MLGALTVSTLRGESGYQRKEVAKLVHWLAGEPRPDVVNLPNSMLIALAAPIRRVLQRPIVVTLQGDDLFLDGLTEPYKRQALDLIRGQVHDVDLFVSVSEYYTAYMAEYLRIPRAQMRTVPLGVNVRTSGRRRRSRAIRSRSVTSRASRPRKGCTTWPRRIASCDRSAGCRRRGCVAAGYLGADHHAYLADVQRSSARRGSTDEFQYPGTVDRDAKARFLRSLDVLSVPSGYHEPKGLYLLEAMACGVPVVQPNHGAFPELLQQTGGGLLAQSEQPADVADAIMDLWRDPARAAALGAQGADGVRAFTVTP